MLYSAGGSGGCWLPGRYKIKTISELCGFSPTLLRAWESRHGLLQPVRQPSGHRLYTDDDLAVLRRVGQLLAQGQSIGGIAAIGREALLDGRPDVAGAVRVAGASLPIEFLRSEALQGAVALDEARIRRALDHLEILLTKREIVHNVVGMIAKEIGSMWAAGEATVASEHLLSLLLEERVRAWTSHEIATARPHRRVLCAGLPGEHHQLGMAVVVYELRGVGLDVVNLGSGLPLVDLEMAIETVQPRTVCLSVTRLALFQVHKPDLLELVARQPGIDFVLGGPAVTPLEGELGRIRVWPPHRPLSDLAEGLL